MNFDGANEGVFMARDDGFIVRSRINTVMDANEDRYDRTLNTGAHIISMDQARDLNKF